MRRNKSVYIRKLRKRASKAGCVRLTKALAKLQATARRNPDAIGVGSAISEVRKMRNYACGRGIHGLGDGCRDSSGNFIPVPACMGRHVPRSSGGRKKGCQYGRNKRTGKCLKHPRRK